MAKKFVSMVNQLKPVLKKYIPAGILRKSKELFLHKITIQIQNTVLAPFDSELFEYGINLIGPIGSATGLGQSFRLIERIIGETGIPYIIYNHQQNTQSRINIQDYEQKISKKLKYGLNLWHVNPSEFAETFAAIGRESFDLHYNIAFWLWELEDFPDEWTPFFQLLDEIWTPSEFISQSIRKKTTKPVYTIPYFVTAETQMERFHREYFGLPQDKFLFLLMYDVQSITERKNPDGAIEAFKIAFQHDDPEVGIVLKLNSAKEADLERIRDKLVGYKNVYLIHRNMSKIEVNSLVASVDVFVSLHRAEGFGLVLAEAMLNHVPTIATNWSANTEFMNAETACMVDYSLVTLDKTIPPYKKGCRWADPDVSQAAGYMRKLKEDPEFYKTISENAYVYMQNHLGIDAIKGRIVERIESINHD